MTTAALRCLVIGSKGHVNAKCVDWYDDPLPVLPDYDVAIINVRSLNQDALARLPYVRMKEICLTLLRLLEFKRRRWERRRILTTVLYQVTPFRPVSEKAGRQEKGLF